MLNFEALGNLRKLVGQAGIIRDGLRQAQERAARRHVEGAAGGGLVKVSANGLGEVLEVSLDPEALKDPESLGPLIAAAVNAALRRSQEALQEEAGEALRGMQLPPETPGS